MSTAPEAAAKSARPLRVLQLCAVDFTIRNFLAPLIRFLGDHGCEVWAGCSRGPHFEELRRSGINMVEFPMKRSTNLLHHAKAFWALVKWLRENRIDLLHVHTPVAALVGRAAGRIAGVPIIVYTAHGFYFHEGMPAWKRRTHVALEWCAARAHDYLFTQSREDALTALESGIERRGRVRAIGNGVDLVGRFSPKNLAPGAVEARRAELRIPEGKPVVAMIGRMVREKGFLELVEAAALIKRDVPDALFLCIGDTVTSEHDDAKASILQRVETLGLKDSFRFAGLREDIPELLALCDVYTLPSWREGMPRSIIEAMGMGKPVVATQIRGCREEVVEGETGFLVPVRDPAALGGSISYLLRHPEIARAMGAAGQRRALQRYDENQVLRRQWRVFQRLAKTRLGLSLPDAR